MKQLRGSIVVAALVGCSSTTTPPPPVASVTVLPAAATLLTGDTVRLVATVVDASRDTLKDRPITWRTNNAAVATVSASGLVTGVGSGTASISAVVESESGASGVTVLLAASALAGVWDWTEHFDDPTNSTVCDDTGSYVFTASGVGFAGTSYQVGTCQTSGGPLDNTHSDPVANGAVGQGAVGFDVGVGQGLCHYTAVLSGQHQERLSGTATCGTASGTWSAVQGGPIASVAIVPRAPTVPPGAAVPLSAALRNAAGDRVFGRAITWSSDDPGIAPVDASGLLTAVAAGRTTVRATAGGALGMAPITVAGDSIGDPVGDTYGTPGDLSQPDITMLAAAHDSDALTIVIRLASPVGLVGYVDLDVDQNPNTGGLAQVDAYRPDPGGSSGLGVEFTVDLSNHLLVDVVNGVLVDYVASVYNGNTVTVRIPLRELAGSNGNVNLATVVGDDNGPTDIAPNEGHLTMGAPNMVAAVRARPLSRISRSWAARVVAPAPTRIRGTKLPLGR
jgi:Bacterial Ig-like domain (group 2)